MTESIFEKLQHFVQQSAAHHIEELVINEDGSGTIEFEYRSDAEMFVEILGLDLVAIDNYDDNDLNNADEPEVYIQIPLAIISKNIHALLTHLEVVPISID
jgi:hypothetical protein